MLLFRLKEKAQRAQGNEAKVLAYDTSVSSNVARRLLIHRLTCIAGSGCCSWKTVRQEVTVLLYST